VTPLPIAVVESDLVNIDPNDVVPIYTSTHVSVEAALALDRQINTLWVRRQTHLQCAVKLVPFRRNPHTICLGVPVDQRGIGYHFESEERHQQDTRGACQEIDSGYASNSESGSDRAGSSSDESSVDGSDRDNSPKWPLQWHSGSAS
jgi:hypothetical protein